MPKTIKSLEAAIVSLKDSEATLRELREDDRKHMEWQTSEINQLRDHIKSLESDKQWLKSMHSAMLQATAEMFRNR